jgi:hypothetical protein
VARDANAPAASAARTIDTAAIAPSVQNVRAADHGAVNAIVADRTEVRGADRDIATASRDHGPFARPRRLA